MEVTFSDESMSLTGTIQSAVGTPCPSRRPTWSCWKRRWCEGRRTHTPARFRQKVDSSDHGKGSLGITMSPLEQPSSSMRGWNKEFSRHLVGPTLSKSLVKEMRIKKHSSLFQAGRHGMIGAHVQKVATVAYKKEQEAARHKNALVITQNDEHATLSNAQVSHYKSLNCALKKRLCVCVWISKFYLFTSKYSCSSKR